MDPKPLSWVLEAVKGTAYPSVDGLPRVNFRGVSTDSRHVRGGEIFVALSGENFDGHEYVGEAFRRGAVAALISRDVADLGGFRDRPVVRVKNTRRALGHMARAWRRELKAEIVAVTGSNGKTTVKNLIAHLTEPVGPVIRAERSFNNDVGLPLTLLSMDSTTRIGVVELGSNHPGEIAELARIAAPDVGVVTNVGEAHLEGFGGILGVAAEKGALVEALPRTGVAFLNQEDFHCREMSRRASCAVVRYGFDAAADLWGLKRMRREDGISFYLYGKMEMRLMIPGLHNAMNALAAVGVALHCGVSPAAIRERLLSFRLPEMRLNRTVANGVTLINDAYNANPASVLAAIEELRAMPATGRRIFVIGDMFELGEYSGRLHRQVGRRGARAGIDVIWAVGDQAHEIARGAGTVTRWTGNVHESGSTQDAVADVPVDLAEGDLVLVKGSRGMRLERVYGRLAEIVAGERIPSTV